MDNIIMPKQGLQMTEGTIIKWLISEGEQVTDGQPLLEIETDKVTTQIEAPVSGTLLKIISGEGETVPVAQTVITSYSIHYTKLYDVFTAVTFSVCPNEQTCCLLSSSSFVSAVAVSSIFSPG